MVPQIHTTRCVKKCLRTSSLDRPFSSFSWWPRIVVPCVLVSRCRICAVLYWPFQVLKCLYHIAPSSSAWESGHILLLESLTVVEGTKAGNKFGCPTLETENAGSKQLERIPAWVDYNELSYFPKSRKALHGNIMSRPLTDYTWLYCTDVRVWLYSTTWFNCLDVMLNRNKTEAIVISAVNTPAHATMDVIVDVCGCIVTPAPYVRDIGV